MSEISEENTTEPDPDAAPPRPDVPVPPSGKDRSHARREHDDEPRGARMKMAGEVESGRTPYDYSAEIEKAYREGARKSGKGSPLVNIMAVAAFFLIFAAAFMGWKMFDDMSSEMDKMSLNVRELAEQLSVQREKGMRAGAAVTRSELRKTLIALDAVMALGDEELSEKASRLRDEVLGILSAAGHVGGEETGKDVTEPEPGASDMDQPAETPEDMLEPQSGEAETGLESPQGAPDLPQPVSPFDMEVEPLPGESVTAEPSL